VGDLRDQTVTRRGLTADLQEPRRVPGRPQRYNSRNTRRSSRPTLSQVAARSRVPSIALVSRPQAI
jgi:hypothetical protein